MHNKGPRDGGRVPSLDLPRLVLGLGILGTAAAWDLRTRTVPDGLWVALGMAGLALLGLELAREGQPPELFLLLGGTGLLFLDALWDRRGLASRRPRLAWGLAFGLYATAAGMIIAPGVLLWGESGRWGFLLLLGMPIMILVAYALYALGLVAGGADAKALMAIALMVPRSPVLGPLPLWRPLLLPFPLVALVYWGLLTLPLPLAFLALNAARGDLKFPEALMGYRVSVVDPPRFVWFMDRVEGGQLVRRRLASFMVPPEARGSDPAEEARRLREAGLREAWATPLTPGLAFLAAGYLLAFVLGNPLLPLLNPGQVGTYL